HRHRLRDSGAGGRRPVQHPRLADGAGDRIRLAVPVPCQRRRVLVGERVSRAVGCAKPQIVDGDGMPDIGMRSGRSAGVERGRVTPVLVVMGVSGSGKSTVARLLAEKLGWDMLEGDDLHPETNVAKMASGTPLTDEDRWPWLHRIAAWIDTRQS